MIRIFALIVAAGLITLLIVAATLTPSPSGLGTHQKLGLPPCSVRLLLGVRCPACGMTTSWSHFGRGEWASSVRASWGGFLLAVISVLIAALSGRTAMTGRLPRAVLQRGLAWAIVGIAAVATVQWMGRLLFEGNG